MPALPDRVDVCIIGGGIVGLATAMALAQRHDVSIAVVEAEERLAEHQTGHNSGVIHSGLYYRPGSLKASLCVSGRNALYGFCAERGIAYERCGKIVVATSQEQVALLHNLHERGLANGLEGLRWLEAAELLEREPHVRGQAGLLVPVTGIVDFKAVAQGYARVVLEAGHSIHTSARVTAVSHSHSGSRVRTTRGDFDCRFLINCGGLQADRVARMCGVDPQLRLIPFRGEYYEIVPQRRRLVRNLIYPVPDPRYPFLGVHFTRMIDGRVEAGPNAVLAFKRHGYKPWSFSLRDSLAIAGYRGFWPMVAQHWRMGVGEMYRSVRKGAFVAALREMLPEITAADLRPAESGVRAQAVERNGALVDDFRIVEADRMVHVLNAPSPAATASISIGEYIARRAVRHFGLVNAGC